MTCKTCGKDTPNHYFCSRSCAATFNNKRSPKRKKTQTCKTCGTPISRDRTYCLPCWNQSVVTRTSNLTIGEYQSRPSVADKHPSWRNAHIREFARRWHKDKTQACQVCGYSKHVEIAHIRPLASFDQSAKLSEVNSPNNVVGLCPNCHWEFDNGWLVVGAEGLEPSLSA